MWTATIVLALFSAAPKVKIDLRPLKPVTVLPMHRCEVEVTFRLSVSDGGREEFYCPRVVWEWEDGTRSIEESDCPPFDQAAPADHRKTWLRTRDFQRSGSYAVRACLCKGDKRVSSVETTAVISGWDGYAPDQRESFGCSPPRLGNDATQENEQALLAKPAQAMEPCR